MSRLSILSVLMAVIVGCWGSSSPYRDPPYNPWPADKTRDNTAAVLSRAKKGGSDERDDDDGPSLCCLLLEAELETLKGSFNTLEGTVSDLGGTVSDLGDSFTTLEGTVSDLGGTVSGLEGTVTDLGNNVTNLEDTVSDLGDTVSDLGGTVSDLGGTVSDLGDTVSELEGTVTELGNNVTNLEGTVSDLGSTVSDLEGTVSDLEITVTDLGDDVANLEDTVTDALTNLTGRVSHLEDTVNNPDPLEGLVFLEDNCVLAFRATAGIGQEVWAKYSANGTNDDGPLARSTLECGCLTVDGSLPCNTHYRSRLLDDWPGEHIDTVRVTVYENGVAQRFVEFDGSDSTYLNWFTMDRIVDSDWTDVAAGPFIFMSIYGFEQASVATRRFLLQRNGGGCASGDRGWLLVPEVTDVCVEFVPPAGPFPLILYSSATTNIVLGTSVTTLEGSVTTLEGSVTTLQGSFDTLQGSFDDLEGTVLALQGSVDTLQDSVDTFQGSVDTLQGSVTDLEGTVTDLEGTVTDLEDTVNNPDPLEGLVFLEDNCVLAFRATAGIGQEVWAKYSANGTNDDGPLARSTLECGCLTVDGSLPCNTHYRSRLLDDWPGAQIDTVRVTVYENGVAQRFVEFDGTDSTYLNWFTMDRIVDSDWTDVAGGPFIFMSIYG
nr:hypothetical protein BaRGS_027026 [Batillaria attramentaria]